MRRGRPWQKLVTTQLQSFFLPVDAAAAVVCRPLC